MNTFMAYWAVTSDDRIAMLFAVVMAFLFVTGLALQIYEWTKMFKEWRLEQKQLKEQNG